MVGGQVRLRLLPELVVVAALDDFPTHAVDSLYDCDSLHDAILGARTNNEPVVAPIMNLRRGLLDLFPLSNRRPRPLSVRARS